MAGKFAAKPRSCLSGSTPSVCSRWSQPPSPRGRLSRWRVTLRHCQKASPWGSWQARQGLTEGVLLKKELTPAAQHMSKFKYFRARQSHAAGAGTRAFEKLSTKPSPKYFKTATNPTCFHPFSRNCFRKFSYIPD